VYLFIFMPIIRYECEEFVKTWNAHTIRRQPKRPNVTPGVPDDLYFNPPFGIERFERVADLDTIERLAEAVSDFGQ
jgi:hypothetical protein